MTAVINSKCSSCGNNHNFCAPDIDLLADGRLYVYVCPDTQKTAWIIPKEFNEVVQACPSGSVTIRRFPEHDA